MRFFSYSSVIGQKNSELSSYNLQQDSENHDDDESEEDEDSLSSHTPVMDLTTSMEAGPPKPRSGSTSRHSSYYPTTTSTMNCSTAGVLEHELRSVTSLNHSDPLKSPPKSTFRYDTSTGWDATARSLSNNLSTSSSVTSNHGLVMPTTQHQQIDQHQHVPSSPPPASSTLASSISLNSPGSGSSSSMVLGGDTALSLAQMRKRKRRPQPIPEDCKDDAYWERRKRNNESAKRSREMRRMKEQQTTMRVIYLEQDNLRLKTEVDMLRTELEKLREILYNRNSNFH